jgi:hypothetical protein
MKYEQDSDPRRLKKQKFDMLAKPAEFGNFESKSCEGSKNYILLEG